MERGSSECLTVHGCLSTCPFKLKNSPNWVSFSQIPVPTSNCWSLHEGVTWGGCFRKTRAIAASVSAESQIQPWRTGAERHLHGNRGVDRPLGISLLEKRWSLVAEWRKEAHGDVCSEAQQTETYLWIWCFNTQAATSDHSHRTNLTFPVESWLHQVFPERMMCSQECELILKKKPPPDMLKRFLHVERRICIFRLGLIAPPDTGWLFWATQTSISTRNLEWKECWLQIDALYNPLKSPMRCVLCKKKKLIYQFPNGHSIILSNYFLQEFSFFF